MSVVNITELRTYINNYETSTEINAQLEGYISTAQSIVEDYLGYKLESKNYDKWVSGNGSWKLYLKYSPITELTSVEVDGVSIPTSSLCFEDDLIYSSDRSNVFTKGEDNIRVKFTSGYTSSTVPEIIKTTILRISALLWNEQDGNIGITSKSFADGSRTFVSYTNFNKYLHELQKHRGKYF